MAAPFDLLVIGAGSGGLAAAKRAARHGATVAIVEGDRVGGTCVIRGCVPKKLLVYGAEYRDLLEEAGSFGWSVPGHRCDPSALLANVRREVDRLNALHISLLEKAGVTLIPGWAHFEDAHTVVAGGERLQARHILIAVGGRPQRLPIPGGELGWVSDDLFLQEQLPASVLIVGAGYIACEFAGILAGLGVAVTQVYRGQRLLRGFDAELVEVVQEGLQAQGVQLRPGLTPEAISAGSAGFSIRAGGEELRAEALLQATGRLPRLEGLALEAAGVLHDGRRILVDGGQTTNVPHIHAVGDVTDRINLTPVAVDEGRALADALFAGGTRTVNHDLVASAVFTQPELATVGLSEEAALARHGADGIEVFRARFRSLRQTLPARGPRCLLKLVVDRSNDRVLGVHMVGSHAAEIIQMAAIAIGMGATKADFDRTMALHPSIAEEFVTMV
jgi:glutathione reductase (NADPH)